MKKLIAFAVVILGFSAVSFGQTNSATATATSTIVAPLTIANAGDMNFGTVYPSASADRTLTLSTGGVRSGTAGFNATSTAAAAHFTVTGTNSTAYNITLPIAAVTTTTMPEGATAMTVDTWVSDPATSGATSVSGTQTINVGATLHIGTGQVAGLYVTAPFTVTVNYQ